MNGEVELLGERIAEQAAHLDAATHRLLTDLREFDARGGWHTQGASSCAHWLSWRVGWGLGTARDRVRVACKLGEFPATDDALRRGELSYSKVRAILRVATPTNEAMLLECARLSTASQLENLSRKYARVQAHCKDSSPRDDEQRRYVRRRDTHDGMVKIEAVLHPEEAELVWTMLDHAAKQLAHASRPGHPCHDSAEMYDRTGDWVAPDTVTSPIPARSTTCPTGVSAETHDAEGATASVSSSEAAESQETAASESSSGVMYRTAESAEQNVGADTTIARVSAHAAACQADVSAEASTVCDTTAASGARPGPAPAGRDLAAGRDPASAAAAAPGRPASVLQQAVDATKRAFNRADALLAVAHAYVRGDHPNRTPIDVMVTIPLSDLREGVADPAAVGCMGTSCLGAETVRRLSCDAGVIEVVEDEHGVPLSVGRKRRTIAGSIKRALWKRDSACTYPGCTHRMFLEGHHIQHWADGGETSLRNAALLCTLHHRYVHEYGYRIELGADQRPQFRDPRGRLVASVPERSLAPDLGWPAIRVANEPLAIDSATIACGWDGTPMPYGRVVGHLVVVDGLT